MSTRIQIEPEMLDIATCLANETYERFKGHSGYYENTLNSHIVGKIGELACAQWAGSLGIHCDQAFRDLERMNEADLILILGYGRRLRVEVKSWSSDSWQPFGRCVPVGQMPQIRAKADIVIWCSVTPLMDLLLNKAGDAEIAGWNTSEEIATITPIWTGPPDGRLVCNHQVPVTNVRSIDQLVAMLHDES